MARMAKCSDPSQDPKVLEEFMETYRVIISFLKIKKLELSSYSVITYMGKESEKEWVYV